MSSLPSPKCDHVSEGGVRCLRKALDGKKKCSIHSKISETPKAEINKVCPICLEEEESGMYLLSCHHRCHSECMKGLTSLRCPMCREDIINLPKEIKEGILSNGRKYAQEEEISRRNELIRMIEQERQSTNFARLPPQMEIIMAMRYLHNLGIPSSLIPADIQLEIDPESPLPSQGSIFQVAVRRIIENIQNQIHTSPEEDDMSDLGGGSSDEEELAEDDDCPFYLEGQNPNRITHSVRTVPLPNPRSLALAGQIPMLFNTMGVILSELDGADDLSDHDFSDTDRV